MSSSDRLDAVGRLLEDDCTQTILRLTRERPMSAPELTERCDASRATVYRRLDELAEQGLLDERTAIDEDGHHRTTYTATLEKVVVELTEDGFEITVTTQQRAADRLTDFVEGIYD